MNVKPCLACECVNRIVDLVLAAERLDNELEASRPRLRGKSYMGGSDILDGVKAAGDNLKRELDRVNKECGFSLEPTAPIARDYSSLKVIVDRVVEDASMPGYVFRMDVLMDGIRDNITGCEWPSQSGC